VLSDVLPNMDPKEKEGLESSFIVIMEELRGEVMGVAVKVLRVEGTKE